MSRTYTVLCLSEAVSPITHAARAAGNESIVMREPVCHEGGVSWVPVLSGNALRHRLVREPGMLWLVREYGLAGRLTLEQLNFLLHGGALTESGGREDTRVIADMQRLWPLVRLLGGALPGQILAGSLLAGRGTLVCRENARHLEPLLPEGWSLPGALHSAEHFVSGYQYTRGDGRKRGADLLAEFPEGEADSNLMIFAGQAVTRGACFLHAFTLQLVSEVELGALAWSLRLWQESGGTVGGQAARGHGRLHTLVHCDEDLDAAAAAYVEYARSVRVEAVAWLEGVFAPRASRRPRKRAAST